MTIKQTKEPTEIKDTVDWKHATVRQNCLNEAAKLCSIDPDTIIPLADKMYRFVIGEPIEASTVETPKEWK